jgi:hypothetical protein
VLAVVGGVWVWLGGTLRCGFGRRLVVWARLGTLLGPEETPVGVVLGSIPGSVVLTHGFSVWWRRCGRVGVVVC